jgi:hypothetical protein
MRTALAQQLGGVGEAPGGKRRLGHAKLLG